MRRIRSPSCGGSFDAAQVIRRVHRLQMARTEAAAVRHRTAAPSWKAKERKREAQRPRKRHKTEAERERETDRQTDTEKKRGRGRRLRGRERKEETDRQTDRQTARQKTRLEREGRQKGRKRERQRGRKTEKNIKARTRVHVASVALQRQRRVNVKQFRRGVFLKGEHCGSTGHVAGGSTLTLTKKQLSSFAL